MRTPFTYPIALLLLALCTCLQAQDQQPLRLVQSIPVPQVKGRLDHMHFDLKGQRLFIAGLENGSVEIVDLRAAKWISSIPGFKKPQGIWYVAELGRLFVASGDDGMLRVFRGDTLKLLDSIRLDLGANRIAYDEHAKQLYVGYGGKDAGKDHGEIAIISARQGRTLGQVPVAAHPAELLLDKSGRRLFAFIPTPSRIQVIDTKKRKVLSTWPVGNERPGDAAFDEVTHRLMIGTRKPAEMIVIDSTNGKQVASLPTVEGMDGVYFDSRLKRIYVSGGRGFDVGFIFVYQQKDADHYELLGKIHTRSGAGTSLWIPELNRYYVAAPATDKEDAAILVYEPQA